MLDYLSRHSNRLTNFMDASKDDALNGWDAPRIWLRQNLGKMEELLYDGYSKHQEPRIFKK